MSRPPFVSGLADGDTPKAVPDADARGAAIIASIRQAARQEADELKSKTVPHFDGVERTPADPAAIERKRVCEATVCIVDRIMRRPAFYADLAAELAAKFG